MAMTRRVSGRWLNALALSIAAWAPLAQAQVTFYEHEDFRGRLFNTPKRMGDLANAGFNDSASSIVVEGQLWEVCEDTRYRGRCRVLRQGRYHSLIAMGLNQRIASLRRVGLDEEVPLDRYAPAPAATRDYRRRPSELLYLASVTAARAVWRGLGQPCWVEDQDLPLGDRPSIGIMDYQLDKDPNGLARPGPSHGAGFQAENGRDHFGQPLLRQEVPPCKDRPIDAAPLYWDLSYTFRGTSYSLQTLSPPGRSVFVNRYGEPRE